MTPHPYYEPRTHIGRALADEARRLADYAPHETGPLVASIRALATEPCEDFTGPHTCEDRWSGRTPDAHYLADRYCWPCRIRHALRQANLLTPPPSPHQRTTHQGAHVGRSAGRSRARARGRRIWWALGAWWRDLGRASVEVLTDSSFWLAAVGLVVMVLVIMLSINSGR